ncbi:MAG TPA: response regulator [Vicinamibacterales bacterium]|nr:response regulator [Vicinamibacterales bacterium]
MRILVVDDHRNTREAIALGLAPLGVEVLTAASGADALRQLAVQPCEWILCDVRMPGMTGIEFAAEAYALNPESRVILMTAHDVGQEERLRVAALGVEILIKPVTARALVDRCRTNRRLMPETAGNRNPRLR